MKKIKLSPKKVDAIKELLASPHRRSADLFDMGFDQGVLAALEVLKIKIDGVNA